MCFLCFWGCVFWENCPWHEDAPGGVALSSAVSDARLIADGALAGGVCIVDVCVCLLG